MSLGEDDFVCDEAGNEIPWWHEDYEFYKNQKSNTQAKRKDCTQNGKRWKYKTFKQLNGSRTL